MLAFAAVALGGAGCPLSKHESACTFAIEAVVGDASGNVFIAGRQLRTADGPFGVIKRNASGGTAWQTPLPSFDGTNVRLAVPAAGGGVIALGSGAAATRFDDAGGIVWVIGYPTTQATLSTVTSDDRVVVADIASVRLFESDGSVGWALALPDNVEALKSIAADGAGGAWLLGSFSGSAFPPLAFDGTAGGAFLIHLDRDGQVEGGRAWRTSVQLNELIGGDPLVARGYGPAGAAPDWGLLDAGRENAVFAFDETGAVTWAHREITSPTMLTRSAQGDLIAVDVGRPFPEEVLQFTAVRWDAAGLEAASSMFSIPNSLTWNFDWRWGPAGAGVLIGGTVSTEDCSREQSRLVRVRTDLTFEQLGAKLP